MSGLQIPPRAHYENIADIADYAELECFRRKDGSVSVLDIARIVQRASGRDDELTDDDVSATVRDAFGDLEDRPSHCGNAEGRYPFDLNATGGVLALRSQDAFLRDVYVFLLLVTQMNMRTDRLQGGQDGTLIFEELCSHVAERYWGGPNLGVGRMVFGTARFSQRDDDDDEIDRNSFASAIGELCNSLREGDEFDPKDRSEPIRAKDAKLDIVVWRKFSDRRGGQLIGFGQCKTGTHWQNELTKLQPDAFCQTWLRSVPAVVPVRMFFVSARVLSRWYERSKSAGVLFDRCRIMEFAVGLPESLLTKLGRWVQSAMQSQGLAIP